MRTAIAVIGAGVLALSAAALASGSPSKGYGSPLGKYKTHNLVSDQAGKADLRDPSLVNAWGLSFGTNPKTPAWVADNGADVSTLYTGDNGTTPVKKVPLTVKIPGGAPTGSVFNGSSSFVIGSGATRGPANFLFSSEAGKITAWNGSPPATKAQKVASVHDAIFKGLAIAKTSKGQRLYATDFHHGKVDVWNGKFKRVHHKGAFRDRKLPKRYAPFGIDTVKGDVVVTYAKQDADAEDDVSGAGHGFVDVFNKRGKLLQRFASHGALNSPWGIVMAPKGFGRASGDLLIGNFGNGWINAYKPKTGKFIGTLKNSMGKTISIDGLWALEFGNGMIGTPKTLLFTAGPNDEAHGLFGDIRPG
jgi:uncharacterized protein (TIGR03118 family)